MTVSAARSPQEEAERPLRTTRRRCPTAQGDTIWLCTGTAADCTRPALRPTIASSSATRSSTASLVDENGPRARPDVRLARANWYAASTRSTVYVYAVGRPALRGRPRRRRPALRRSRTTRASTRRRAQRRGHGPRQRHAGRLRDQIEKAAVSPGPTCTEDERTVVIEGSTVVDGATRDRRRPADPAREGPGRRRHDRSSGSSLDADEPAGDLAARPRPASRLAGTARRRRRGTYYTIDFTRRRTGTPRSASAFNARDDAAARGPADRRHQLRSATTATTDCGSTTPTGDYVFPNLRSGPRPHRRRGDRQRDRRRRRASRAASTPSSIKCGDATCTIPGTPTATGCG